MFDCKNRANSQWHTKTKHTAWTNQTHREKHWQHSEMHNKAKILHANNLNEQLNRSKTAFTVATRDKRLN